MTWVLRNLVLVRFKIVLVSAKDRCTVCAECNSGMEIALGTPEWYSKVMYVKWKLVLVRFEIVLVFAQDMCMGLRRMYLGNGNHFGHTRWYF